jgi:hypothetical protein
MIRVTAGWAVASVLVAAGCGGATPPLAGPVVVAPVSPAEPGAYSPGGDKHPGQIVYEDHVEHRSWTRNAVDVPATIAWVMVGARWRPVVLVEIDGTGQRREITTYGPDREFLEHTTAQLAAPPPKITAPPRR